MNCFAKLMVLFALLLGGGCASGSSSVPYLLEQDYRTMTNPELTAYEQELSDELANAAGASGSDNNFSVGFGFGSWSGSSGFGVGVDKALGGSGESRTEAELRQRRDDARAEMKKRGMLPPD